MSNKLLHALPKRSKRFDSRFESCSIYQENYKSCIQKVIPSNVKLIKIE